MVVNSEKQRISSKRSLRKINTDFIKDYEDDVDDYIIEDKSLNIKQRVRNYILLASPYILSSLFSNSMKVATTSNIRTQQQINHTIEESILGYTNHITDCLTKAQETLSQLDIDKKIYEEFRNKNIGVTESLQLSTPKISEPIAPASPILFKGSIENKMIQMETVDEYYGFTMMTDKNGDPLAYYKKWNWSTLENTRHEGMDGSYVLLDEFFTVVNEVTGFEEEGLHPRDPSMSAGNIVNCGCWLTFFDEDWNELQLTHNM